MSNTNSNEEPWGAELEAPPPLKRGFPKWAWFCGGGCAALVIIAVAVLGWVYSQFKDASDPDKQWPRLQTVLPFAERPTTLELHFGNEVIEPHFFMLSDDHGHVALVFSFERAKADAIRSTMLDPESTVMSAGGMTARRNPSAAVVSVQGRELKGVRFTQESGLSFGVSEADAKSKKLDQRGPTIALECSAEGADRLVILQLTHSGATDPVSDDEVRAFLEPFHVGPDHK